MDTDDTARDFKPKASGGGRSVPVLCHEEAMVYLENYLRGSRIQDDMRALASYVAGLPSEYRRQLPVDADTLLDHLANDLHPDPD